VFDLLRHYIHQNLPQVKFREGKIRTNSFFSINPPFPEQVKKNQNVDEFTEFLLLFCTLDESLSAQGVGCVWVVEREPTNQHSDAINMTPDMSTGLKY
jgi:hypothetical protein